MTPEMESDYNKIMKAVRSARKRGWKITRGLMNPNRKTKECCALSALRTKAKDYKLAALDVLGWGPEDSFAFACGFDGALYLPNAGAEANELGKKVAKACGLQ